MSGSIAQPPGGRRIGIRSTGGIGNVRRAQAARVPDFSGIAQGFEAARQAANQVADVAFNNLEQQRRQEARQQARRFADRAANPDQQPIIDAGSVDQSTVFGEAFTEAAVTNFRENVVGDVRSKANEALATNPADPESVSKEVGQFTDSLLQNVPGAIAREVEPELRELNRRTVSQATTNQIEQQRTEERQSALSNVQERRAELTSLIRQGQEETPGFQQARQAVERTVRSAEQAGLLTPAEAEQARRNTERTVRSTTVAQRARAIADGVNPGDPRSVQQAQDQIDKLVSNTDPGTPEERRELRNIADDQFTRSIRDRRRIQRAQEREREQQSAQTRLELERRLADPALDDPTVEEIRQQESEGALTTEDAVPLLRSVGGRRQEAVEQQRKRQSTLLIQDFKNNRASFADVRSGYENGTVTFSDFVDARGTALEREAEERAKLEEIGVEKWLANRYGQLDLRPGEFENIVTDMAQNKESVKPSEISGEVAKYRKAFEEEVDQRRVEQRALSQMRQQGAVRGEDERQALADALGPMFDPTRDTTPQGSNITPVGQAADMVGHAGFIPDNLKARFDTIEQEDEETLVRLVQTFDAIRSRDDRGSGDAILQDELSSGTYEKMRALSRTLPIANSPTDALEQANKLVDDNSSADRRLANVVDAPEGTSERDALVNAVPNVLKGQFSGTPSGSFDAAPPIGLTDIPGFDVKEQLGQVGQALGLIEDVDPRFKPFLREARRRGIDLSNVEVPQRIQARIGDRARTLIGLGRIGREGGVEQAVKTAASQVFREVGPELTDNGEVRFTERPIATEANNENMPPGVEIDRADVQQDIRHQLRGRIEPPEGFNSIQEMNLRTQYVPGSANTPQGASYRVMYEDPQAKGVFRPLRTQDEHGNVTDVRYQFDFEESIQRQVLNAALTEGAASTIPDLPFGDETIRQGVANLETEVALRIRRLGRELETLFASPDAEKSKETAQEVRRKKEELNEVLLQGAKQMFGGEQ